MSRTKTYKCLLCGYNGEHQFIVPALLYGQFPQEIFQCPQCGLGYVLPQPTREELDKLYSEEYFFSDSVHMGYADYAKSRSRQFGEGRIFTKNLKRKCPAGKLLEVGCATGYFLEGVISVSGWEGYGVELSQWAAEKANRIPGLKVTQGMLEELALPSDSFDTVVVRDLLEHTPNPITFLQECHRVLKAGGILYIKFPNGRCNLQLFIRTFKKYNKPVNLSHAHLFFFEPKSVRLLMNKCGFIITNFYAVGLKRGLRDLGFIPIIKRKDSTIPVEFNTKKSGKRNGAPANSMNKPIVASAHLLRGCEGEPFKSPEFHSDTELITYRRSDLYYRYIYFFKHSLCVPLALGHNYIIWAVK
jgi:2-polyprenyl-3-methyl-5-hydroxy-6-metoxy-1,4-benzoquinol methylase